MSLAIGGQLLAALLLDHFGLLGLTPRAVDVERLVGAGLLLGGVYLITRHLGGPPPRAGR
jgi:transporter family-2 protein